MSRAYCYEAVNFDNAATYEDSEKVNHDQIDIGVNVPHLVVTMESMGLLPKKRILRRKVRPSKPTYHRHRRSAAIPQDLKNTVDKLKNTDFFKKHSAPVPGQFSQPMSSVWSSQKIVKPWESHLDSKFISATISNLEGAEFGKSVSTTIYKSGDHVYDPWKHSYAGPQPIDAYDSNSNGSNVPKAKPEPTKGDIAKATSLFFGMLMDK